MALTETGIAPLDEYTAGVMHGRINVCKWVRLAVERHYRDLDRAANDPEFPYYFEPKAHWHYVNHFEQRLEHYDGFHAGNPIIFEPWQHFVWGSPFGWLKEKRLHDMPIRRFRERIIIIPKKQGKSILVGGTMLYMFYYDEWPGAQVYALAINASHAAKLGYRDAEMMVDQSEEMSELFKVKGGAAHRGIYTQDEKNFIQPMTSKPDTGDGPKVHYAGNDEVKDWEDYEIYKVVKQGTAANPNSLIDNITTSGSNMSSLGYDRQERLKKILEGSIIDEQTFGVIFTIDQGEKDDPEPNDRKTFNEALALPFPEAWEKVKPIIKKANPNFGVSVDEDYYKQELSDAQGSEQDKNIFLTKHLDVWVNAMSHYFDITDLTSYCQAEHVVPEEFYGQPCYLHADLSSKKDITSLYALFRDGTTQNGKKRYAIFGINFLPEAVVSENIVGKRSEYNKWAEEGHFELTPGNTIDYEAIKDKIKWFNKHFRVMKLGLDDWGNAQLAQDMQKKRIKVVEIKQNTKNLSEPMKILDTWISYKRPKDGEAVDQENPDSGIPDPRIRYNGDPVFTWAMSNVVAKEDANENVYPRKEHRDSKIDPAVAAINLLALELAEPLPKPGTPKRVPKVWSV